MIALSWPTGEDDWEVRAPKEPSVQIGHFTKIPNKFFGSGTAAAIGSSASLLYFALCENANRNSKNMFRASDRALASETGLSPRTIRNARIKLREEKLISCSRQEGQSYYYDLLPLQLKWIPLGSRLRQKDKPRALTAKRAKLEK